MRKLLVLAVLLLAGGCGIQPTGVIPLGPAPTIHNRSSPDLTLYFVTQGRVVSSTRVAGTALSPADALNTLIKGPNQSELSQGLYTELPQVTSEPITVDTRLFPVEVFVPFSLKELTDVAINQLACTAIAALATSGEVRDNGLGVFLTMTDGKLGPRSCQTF
jgi:hypothetical protein